MDIMRIIWPVIAIQLAFAIVSIVHILKNKNTRVFSWEIWVFIVLLINIIGPLLYFTIGREED